MTRYKKKVHCCLQTKAGLNILKLRDRNDLNNTLKKVKNHSSKKSTFGQYLTSKAEQTRLLKDEL